MQYIADSFRPDWTLGADTTNLEAMYRAYLTIGIAANVLKKKAVAQEMYFKALQMADVLGDPHSRLVVLYETAYMHMVNDDLQAARSLYFQVAQASQPNSMLQVNSLSFASILSWLLGDVPEQLPEWARVTLVALHMGRVPAVDAPAAFSLPRVAQAFRLLRRLGREFNLNLPSHHVRDHRLKRAQLLEDLQRVVGSSKGRGITWFMLKAATALALSMNHDLEAMNELRTGLDASASGISLINMVFFATAIQIYANLPALERGEEFQNAYKTLLQQYSALKDYQRAFLLWWMRDFTPVTLYLLSEKHPDLEPYLREFIVVHETQAVHAGKVLKRYPRRSMAQYALELLQGNPMPSEVRYTSTRHKTALETLGNPHVIYSPVVQALKANIK
ncbi:hypothetical protein DC3_53430 [Deinococcus cellulosilyticus NBRC 106333 = KACC 11606]|uniref:Uncharacterized protein n=1 Tax=Deinococcus cellulosilyticus (strain DSM 18568 / NBRC 106333 / KACC 11606 / 5516J-15) TaxID=1223518 RepID=A0A511NB09_DEIC1|nr:hypothetical protein DC3_53430 [Deinococcus cellulosilyticus NBRC 106333 = KACC 11606]